MENWWLNFREVNNVVHIFLPWLPLHSSFSVISVFLIDFLSCHLHFACIEPLINPFWPTGICFTANNLQTWYQPSMAYLKKRSFTLRTVALSGCWVRRLYTLWMRSSTTPFTSSEKTATSRGRMMSCLSTLRIFSQSSPSLRNKIQNDS